MPFYPNAKYLLIDANNYHENGLKAFIAEYPNAQFVLAAAGDKRGEIYFDKNAPLGGVASHT
ncbi:MAG TPA: hypothetical protein PLZ51_26505, partial [Aggregatilineales bacterium]|nr:hypothetical protein [Aggregatilineales bacterium]